MAHNTTASTSASNSSAPNYFHIFINHCGRDVKKTFAAHLYRRLTSHGLRVFLDRPELKAGKRIMSQIEEAIQVASVQIAIFSENYANSRWCLDELRLMVDSEKRGATILPVFYNIKSSDLRRVDAAQDGPYAQALLKKMERYDSARIQGWREALSEVSYISGFELEACNGDEADLLDKVVQRVLKEVPEPELHVAKYATGLGEKIEDFEKTVLSQRRLWRSVEEVHDLFEEQSLSSVIPDVRGFRNNYTHSPELADLSTLPEGFFHLPSKYLELHGRFRILPKEFGNLRNFQSIVLFGCQSMEKLPDSFTDLTNLQVIQLSGCHSLKRLPKSLGDLTNLRLFSLDRCSSLELLPNSFANLANLQGLYLSGCNRLKRLPNSLGDLTNLQRITFINCESLEVLPESFGCLTNLLRIELTGCKRLKNLPDSFTGLMSLQHLKLSDSDRLKRLPKSLGCLTNLQDIILSNCKSLKKLPNSLGDLRNLQGIKLDKCESLEVLPDSFQRLTNLVSIDLGACRSLKMLPNNLSGNLTNLKTVGLSGCESLEKLPHFLGDLTELRSIQLNGCKSLKKLPKSLGWLTNLRGIDLSRCKSLKKLPNSLGNLSQLRFLDLSHCSSTCSITLPGNITTLELLDLSGCVQIAALPAQVEHQKSMVLLNLVGTNLKELTVLIACLSNLKYLFLGSPLLKELPPSFGCLLSLRKLLLHGCQELKRLPDSFALLTQLTELEISKCGIQELPDLMEMNNLEILRVRDCPLLELPFKESAPTRKRKRRATEKGLTRLELLELYCTEVREVSFPEGVCIELRTLRIMCCNDLVKVGSLPATVERLILRGCGALGKVLCGLAKPWWVDLRGCCNVEIGEVPHFGNIPRHTYNPKEEEEVVEVEKEMAALQEGVLPYRFASLVNDMKFSLWLKT